MPKQNITLNLSNARKKPYLIELLPWIGRGTSTAIYPYVFLSRKVYEDIVSANPDPYSVSSLLHEQEHLERARKYGVLMWYASYLFNKDFRFKEELAALEPQLRYVKSQGLTFNLERKARSLSGWLYFRPVSFDKALVEVQGLWHRVG